ncbi:MAG: V-type ATP synthase subunit A, partial [Candidatus Krumholzibacteria bacterium]|nr:V-type ATP synthase subunit A [Candidatus Krumholzibacteria bacterium]
GTLSVIGAVSPPGGDLSDPVVQATLKVVKVFWSLDDQLAFERHFPAIGWLSSYSLYHDNLADYFKDEIEEKWEEMRRYSMQLLQKESELKELVRLVGQDSLSPQDRIIMETTKSIREDFLHQSAFDQEDAYTKLSKQSRMLGVILELHEACLRALDRSVPLAFLIEFPVRERIARMRYAHEEESGLYGEIMKDIEEQISKLSVNEAAGEE